MKSPLRAAALLPLLLLAACPLPLSRQDVDSALDEVPPVITVASPSENASFGRTILITGTVSDDSNAKGNAGRVASLTYEILSHQNPVAATLTGNGSFSISFNTTLTENIVIELQATDWNGNTSSFRLPLTYEGNDIPSFRVTAGNRQVTLSWDPVPGVTGYAIYFEPSALAPTTGSAGQIPNIANTTSSYVLGSLKNGNTYSFLLRGLSVSGSDNYSEVKRAVPLSSFDLFPAAESFFNQIRISWRPLPGISQYEVLRSTSVDGPFQSVSGPINASSYTDTNVQQGVSYYYAVKPAQHTEVVSQAVEAMADPFPTYLNAEVGLYSAASNAQATAVKGSYLYIADQNGPLRVASIAEPTTPVPVASVAGASYAKDVAINGDYAYVAHERSLSVLDISNPASPVLLDTLEVTTFEASGQAEAVAVLGDWAFVACFNDGFSVVDLTDKSNLQEVYHFRDPAPPDSAFYQQVYDVEVVDRAGTTVLLVGAYLRSGIYTVTGSAGSPEVTLLSSALPYASSAKIVGDYAYLASGWYLEVWDVTSLTAPVQRDTLWPDPSEATQAVDVAGGRAYVSIRDTGFAVIDVSDPLDIRLVQSYTTPGEARGITLAGSYAYIADGQGSGVSIYGVASPRVPSLSDSYTLNGPTNLVVFRDHLLVTESVSDWRLSVLNIADPSNLTMVLTSDTLPIDYTPLNLKVVGNYALFAAERSGIMIWDLQDLGEPEKPKVLPPWYVSLPGGNAVGIDVLGAYAYVTTTQSLLNIVDLSWDGNMAKAGSVATQGDTSYAALDVAVRGDYAFVANAEAGLRVVDVRDPKWPAALPAPSAAWSGKAVAVALSGKYALVASDTAGLYVFDVSDPFSPQVKRSGGAEGGLNDVVVRGNFAYVARGAAGIQMMDITDPASPVAVASFVTDTPAQKLAVHGQHLYVLDGSSMLYAVDLMP
jgi:hypothetical protein